jgi:phosphoserine phosphatase
MFFRSFLQLRKLERGRSKACKGFFNLDVPDRNLRNLWDTARGKLAVKALRQQVRMVVFDLDGTLTVVDSPWRCLHEALGTWSQGKTVAQRYLEGEISYKEWAETDVRFWAGAPLLKVKSILDGIPYREGAEEVFRRLKERGVKIVILSAGLSILAEKAARELGADLVIANELRTDDGRLTGEIQVRVGLDDKDKLVRQIASTFNIPLREVALVGDRGPDLANEECVKIAFMPKDDTARREADFIVENDDLRAILQYLS